MKQGCRLECAEWEVDAVTHPPGLRLFHHWWLFRLRADTEFQPEKRAFITLSVQVYGGPA